MLKKIHDLIFAVEYDAPWAASDIAVIVLIALTTLLSIYSLYVAYTGGYI